MFGTEDQEGIWMQKTKARNFTGTNGKVWVLRLYVVGLTEESLFAYENLKNLCEQHLHRKYRIDVVDLLENPGLARREHIVATPTVARNLPKPLKKIVGDLSRKERALMGLDIRPLKTDDN